MAPTPEAWFKALPPITKAYFCAAVGSTLLCTIGVINPMQLYLDFELTFKKFQLWRLLTCFCFFGKFSMPFVFNVFMLSQYTQRLEEGYFQGNRGLADMTFFMMFCAVLMIIISYFMPMFFLGPAMLFCIMHVWARKDPYREVNFWGFAFLAWHFPFVMLLITMLMGGSPVLGVTGIIVGHFYHFLSDVVPVVYNKTVLKTPEALYNLYEEGNVAGRATNWQRGQGYRLQ